MGLDNIVYTKVGVKDKKLSEALSKLCGGSFMTDNNNSFRGKVYDNFFTNETGYSLYESDDFLDVQFEEIIDSLKKLKAEYPDLEKLDSYLYQYNEMTRDELDAFIEVFELCYENGWGINAWY